MGMKTVLVPTENHDAMRSALETALLLARRCGSYIEGFALRWTINQFIGGDVPVPIAVATYRQDIAEEANQARQIFESFMQKNNVPRSTKTAGALSFGWMDEAPEGESFVGSYGRVFDVIVMNRPVQIRPACTIERLNLACSRAVARYSFLHHRPPRQIATNVLIAWNCSTEQARAIALAMPLLLKADRVTVLTVTGGTAVPGPSAEQLIRYLQCNGIATKSLAVELDGRSTGEAILATAQSLSCDLLIKGAYTQSRLRQMIFGGATRHVLENAAIPVLLAN